MKAKSLPLQEAEAVANEIDAKLSAYDFTPSQYVYLKTDENYEARIPSAFVLQHEDWYFIFAEHHDLMVFHIDDVDEIYEYEIKVVHDEISFTEAKDFKPKEKP